KGKNRPIFKTARTSYKSEGVNSTAEDSQSRHVPVSQEGIVVVWRSVGRTQTAPSYLREKKNQAPSTRNQALSEELTIVSSSVAVDAQFRVVLLYLATLYLSKRLDRRQPAIFCQGEWHRVQRRCKSAHGVL